MFYNQYKRIDSFFVNTDLQAKGVPGEGELAILNPLRKELDPSVFGEMPRQPNTNPPGSLRANLIKARELLAQAGWTYRDGALRNAKGESRSSSRFSTTRAHRWSRSRPHSGAICRSSASR